MGKFLVGLGLIVMASAIAFYGLVGDEAGVPPSLVNTASAAAVWVFLAGTLIAILGGVFGGKTQPRR
jgi:hypothetical protein